MNAPPGALTSVPPAGVPLSFLGASAVGLVGFGLAALLAADKIVASPVYPGTLAAVHVGMLAFLTVGVLGALHQFAPVIGQRPLRSIAAARASFVGMVATAWLLPTGFAHGPEGLVPLGGSIGLATVLLVAWNLSGPLGPGATGLPVQGLRMAVAFLVTTVVFGVVYAFNRQTGWFPLLPRRVLAHAHLGLLGWLGLTYVSVAEKLWPMFLLSHRPSDRSGRLAVWCVAAGVTALAPGLLVGAPAVAWAGGLVTGGGLVAHLASLASHLRHRRRPLEVLHAFVLVSSAFLATALVVATLTAVLPVTPVERTRLVGAEVMALTAWLGLAVVGHVHKIVPFIGYQVLRAEGITTGPSGRPLMFADLADARAARWALACAGSGSASMIVGLLTAHDGVLAVGAFALAASGVVTTANLVAGPRRVRRHAAAASRPASPTPSLGAPA